MSMRTTLLLALLLSIGCRTGDAPSFTAEEMEATLKEQASPVRPFDDPQAAEEYARAKRLDYSGVTDPRAMWDRAVAHRLGMPAVSLAAEGRHPEIAADAVSGGWVSLGPGNIGGRTRVLLIDPDDPRVLYAAGVSGGVWKSIDEGESWRPSGDLLANIAVNSLAMDPRDSRVLYAGTGEGYFREDVRGTWLPLRGGGIFRSDDGGETWARLESTLSEDFHWVNDIAVSREESSRLYAATRTGVWRSRDHGASWERVLETSVRGGCLDLELRRDEDRDFLFAACGTFEPATVYRNTSAEADGIWEPVLTRPEIGRTTLAIAPSNPAVVYALSASNVPIGGSPPQGLYALFRSDSEGAAGSWEMRVRGDDPEVTHRLLLTNLLGYLGPECFDAPQRHFTTMGWYCNTIAVDPADPETVWVGGVDLFRSRDGGRNWSIGSYWYAPEDLGAFVHADQHGIAFHPEFDGSGNRTMYVANDGGVFRTRDSRVPLQGGVAAACYPESSLIDWESLNHGFGVTQFYHGDVFPGGDAWLGGTQDNGTLSGNESRGGDGWQRIFGGDGGYVAIDPRDPKRIWLETQWGRIVRTLDGGETFTLAAPVTPGEQFLFITPFTLDPSDSKRLWTGGSRLFRTGDSGDNWSAASTRFSGELVSSLAVSPRDPRIVVAGTTAGRIIRSDQALTATASTSWSGVTPRPGFVSSIAFDPVDDRTVYATYAGFGGRHVWRSTDGGANWTAIDGEGAESIPDIPVHSIVVDPRDSRRLYLGSDLGVFASLDGGQTWLAERDGMPAAVTEHLVITPRAAGWSLFAFTHGRGVWRADLDPAPRRRGVRR